MTIGTCNFVNRAAAYRWYAGNNIDESQVEQLIAEGNVIIGKPEIEDDEYLTTQNGRYIINC